jgi:hypothetical protein
MTGWAILLICSLALIVFSGTCAKLRVILANTSAMLVILSAFDGYLSYKKSLGDGTRLEGSITNGFTHLNDTVGYAPNAGARVTARKVNENEIIYDVIYTINSNGLRTTPPPNKIPVGCVVFFGDSNVFGEGVNDKESLPSQVAVKNEGRYAVANLAFSGYGPHQMLALLQGNHVERLAGCSPTHFIYWCIPEHVERVAGRVSWDRHGPRFKLDSNGGVVRDGNFDSPVALLGSSMRSLLHSWMDRFVVWEMFTGRAGDAELDLLIRIIRKAASLSREQYMDSEFHVILWDGSNNHRVLAIEGGIANNIPVHRITTAIPDFRVNWREYVLSVHDLHPNVRQLGLLADYITSSILRSFAPERSAGGPRSVQ